MPKMYEIEYQCQCVGTFGPNPDCLRCSGDGSVREYVPTLPKGYSANDAKIVYGPDVSTPKTKWRALPPYPQDFY